MDRRGFTLIELLIVVVIIGILDAVEESYFFDNHVVAPGLADVQVAPYCYSYSPQNTITITQLGGGVGWRGTGTNPAAAGVTCSLSAHTNAA